MGIPGENPEFQNSPPPGAAETPNPELIALAEQMGRSDAPPGGGPGASSPGDGEDKSKQAYGAARGLVGAICALVTRRWPGAIYTDDEQHTMALLLSPVIVKHLTDPWMLKYREEFEAAGFAVYMGYAGYQRHLQARAAPASDAPPHSSWDGPLRPG